MQLFTALGISKDCVDSVSKDLQQLVTDVPATVQAVIQQLTDALSKGGGLPPQLPIPSPGGTQASGAGGLGSLLVSPLPPNASTGTGAFTATQQGGVPIATDLQNLLSDLMSKCAPKPPTSTTQSPPATTQPPAAEQPVGNQQPPAAQQPVSYPGYAPTGAIATPSGGAASDDTGLATLGGGVLLAGAAATAAARFRSRAARGGR